MAGRRATDAGSKLCEKGAAATPASWDRDYFMSVLLRESHGNVEMANMISRDLEREFAAFKEKPLPASVMERMIEAKLMKYGIKRIPPMVFSAPLPDTEATMQLSENAITVLERRYLRKDESNKPIEKPRDMFLRVAGNIAKAERNYDKKADISETTRLFYRLMTRLEFLPNSPTLMNAGRELQQLSACFVLPVEDSMEGIFDSLKHAALIHKSGGGTGFSFSRIRRKNSTVGSTGGVASGPISFMRIFNTATEQVKQGGTRRGANMGILRIDHPDILEFIHAKENDGTLNNFNLSVGLTEAFMEAVKADRNYDLIDPGTKEVTETLRAREVFNEVVDLSWKSGDPGIVFLDRLNRDNPTPKLGEIESTNPCGEQPLLPYEACNLGSVNLAKMVTYNGGVAQIDYERLSRVVHTSARFLDNVIDMSKFPIKRITDMVRSNRKIGLGVMGWADLLITLRIPYNSEEAVRLAETVMAFIRQEARAASAELAEARGGFPNLKGSIYEQPGQPKIRNATTTTIAPTGTLSIVADCSSGIEPLFALSYYRNVMDNDKLVEVNETFREEAIRRGFFSEELMETIAKTGGIGDLEEVPEDVRRIFVTAHDVSPEWHIRMQAAFQKYTDNAVSKTVNFSHDATVTDVETVYMMAYETGCKGVTIYRDGSKGQQVLNLKKESKKDMNGKVNGNGNGNRSKPGRAAPEIAAMHENRVPGDDGMLDRPGTLMGSTTKMKLAHGTLYITVNELNEKPFEVFATIGKSGQSTMAKTEAIGRLVSLSLRHGIPVEKIVEQLKGIGGEYAIFEKDGLVRSIPDAIARILERRYMKMPGANGNNGTNGSRVAVDPLSLVGNACPECGGTVERESGCLVCRACGYSKCA
jgi:ribonucleoside-diphosphate reductase alpha chain